MVDSVENVLVGDAVVARRVVNLHANIVLRISRSRRTSRLGQFRSRPDADRPFVERSRRRMIVRLPHHTRKENAMEPIVLDAAGHRRSPVTMPNYHRGRPPRNKGCRYPADPPTVDEIVAVMRSAGNGSDAARLRALIVILWRAGLRVSEALDLSETDLDRASGGILVRRGKGGSAGRSGWTAGPGHS